MTDRTREATWATLRETAAQVHAAVDRLLAAGDQAAMDRAERALYSVLVDLHREGWTEGPGGAQVVEYGWRLDCATEGCDPPHDDDGQVVAAESRPERAMTINGHATVVVRRRIGPWLSHPPATPDPANPPTPRRLT